MAEILTVKINAGELKTSQPNQPPQINILMTKNESRSQSVFFFFQSFHAKQGDDPLRYRLQGVKENLENLLRSKEKDNKGTR